MRYMMVVTVVCSCVVAGGVPGCSECPETEESLAGLVRIDSAVELVLYFRQQADMYELCQGGGWVGLDMPAAMMPVPGDSAVGERADGGGQGYSGTNVQELGVDEADVVKTDGEYFYVAGRDKLRIVRARPPEQLEQVGQVALSSPVRAMYLYEGRAVVLSQTGGGNGPVAMLSQAEPEAQFATAWQVWVTVIDVSDPAAPSVLKTFGFDGVLNTSRRIDGWLRVILSVYRYGLGESQVAGDPADWLPRRYTRRAGKAAKVGPIGGYDDFYRPLTPDGTSITTIVSINLDDLSAEPETLSVIGESEVVYASRQALYVSDSRYGFGSAERQKTVLHKFDLGGEQVRYVGSGAVTGRLINSFALGEKDGYLRVATSSGWFGASGPGRLTNQVYVLGEKDGALEVVGSVKEIAEGEMLYAARFLGDRGFLITFEKVDPLFVLDLSDPTNPQVVGELEVPGYGGYIHPMGSDHLITIGKDADFDGQTTWFQGVQLAMFDVSDLSDPQLVHRVVLGTRGTESEALWDHHAFNYFAEQDALAVPICLSEGGQGGPTMGQPTFKGLYVYRVTAAEGFELLGRIATQDPPPDYCGGWWGSDSDWTRSVFIGDDVYAATAAGVWAAPLADVDSVPWSLDFD